MAVKTLLPSARVINRPWRSPFDNLFDAFFGEDSRLPVLPGNAAFSPRIDVKERRCLLRDLGRIAGVGGEGHRNLRCRRIPRAAG